MEKGDWKSDIEERAGRIARLRERMENKQYMYLYLVPPWMERTRALLDAQIKADLELIHLIRMGMA